MKKVSLFALFVLPLFCASELFLEITKGSEDPFKVAMSDDRRFDALLDSAAAALGRRDAHAESLLHVATELDDAERAALRESAGRVAERLAERVRGRLEPLLMA